jgi:hypothetical protein
MINLEQYIYPLQNFQQVFPLLYISSKCNIDIEIEFICTTFNNMFKSDYSECDIRNCLNKFFNFDLHAFKNSIAVIDQKLKSKKFLCESNHENCINCNKKLKATKTVSCLVFGINEIYDSETVVKYCNACNIYYNVDHFVKNGISYCYENSQYVATSSESVFVVSYIQ